MEKTIVNVINKKKNINKNKNMNIKNVIKKE